MAEPASGARWVPSGSENDRARCEHGSAVAPRRIEAFTKESALPPIADVRLHLPMQREASCTSTKVADSQLIADFRRPRFDVV